jgi:hypothetical protein
MFSDPLHDHPDGMLPQPGQLGQGTKLPSKSSRVVVALQAELPANTIRQTVNEARASFMFISLLERRNKGAQNLDRVDLMVLQMASSAIEAVACVKSP